VPYGACHLWHIYGIVYGSLFSDLKDVIGSEDVLVKIYHLALENGANL
jgi:hypothetical protein